ncbi:MAG TPA: hypothetical protein V6C65_38810 [Allocoleopsis sp.]
MPDITPAPAENTEVQNPELKGRVDPPAPQEPKKYRVKIDGEEQEVDEQTVVKDYERRAASHKRFEEAAKLRKEAEEILELPKKDLKAFLQKQGLDPQEVAEMLLLSQLQEEFKEVDPDKEELEKYRSKEREEKEAKEKEEFEKTVQEQQANFDTKIATALEGTGLSKDPYTIRSAAIFVRTCLKNGFEPDADEIKDALEGKVKNDYKSVTSSLEGEELVKWLGDELLTKIRKYDLQQLKAKRVQPEIPKANAPRQEQKKPLDKWEIIERTKKWMEE